MNTKELWDLVKKFISTSTDPNLDIFSMHF